MKLLLFFLLMFIGPSEGASGSSEVQYFLSNFKSGEISVDGEKIKGKSLLTVKSISNLKSNASDVSVEIDKKVFIHMSSQSELKISENRLELLKGTFYVKVIQAGFSLVVPDLFDFFLSAGDLWISLDANTKVVEMESVVGEHAVRFDSDDRDILIVSGERIVFRPEYVDGELAYDFLLNQRKIPKMKMEKIKSRAILFLAESHWKRHLVKKVKTVDSKKLTPSLNALRLCQNPAGSIDECYFQKLNGECLRFTCNANGQWGLKTAYGKIQECPEKPTLKSCTWIR